ncbi:MAG: PAS domain S-box protein, partial [Candidatus Omnitrophica bacterium]|nr:PAS domain S-box protein [Candidatus Omnitrophota bacterium]
SNWQDALTILQTEKTDMVLLDLNLGDIDGRHLLDKIKGVPVIVVTGGTSDQTAAEIIQIGVDDFVRKDAAGVYLQSLPIKISTAIERRKAGELFRLAIEAAPSGMLLVDDQQEITFANRMAEEIFGNSSEELVGLPFRQVCMYEDPEVALRPEDLAKTLVEKGRNRELVEAIGIRKDGVQFPMEVGASEIDIHGDPYYLFSVKNIARRKRRETERNRHIQRLERLNAALEERNRELDDFASILSHDLNSPLATIKMSIEFLRKRLEKDRGQDDRVLEETLDGAREAITCVSELVNRVLDFTEKGRQAIRQEEVGLTECVEKAIATLQADIEKSGADIQVQSLPKIQCDRVLVTQVFQNLIQNSIKFHKPGDPTRIEVYSEDLDGREAFVVRDNGLGHESKHSIRMFQPFQYFHSHDHHEGRGLGLGICRRIIEKHGGEIWAEQNPEGGTSVKFTLTKRLSYPEVEAYADWGEDLDAVAR